MGDAWRTRLEAGDVLIKDGGTGTELRRRGAALDAAAWSGRAPVEHYALLRAIHADYAAAGADVLTTCTFGTSRFVLEAAGLGERFGAVNRAAVAAARDARSAAGRDVAIAGAISCLPPHFDPARYPSAGAEADAYRELATLLASEGVDLLMLEMMEETVHAPRALAAARETGLPVWLGVSCRLEHGALAAFDFPSITLERCLDALLPFAPDAVLVMHSPPDAVGPALRLLRERFAGPLGAAPEIGDGASVAALAPRPLAALAADWLESGATILGGCCGTTPEHVRALAAARRAST
jgi:S-methylmethionine-dependent homocysteine/selenocysteine methylase